MENFDYKKYRGGVFNKLKTETDPQKRKIILDDTKSKLEFIESEKLHKSEKLAQKDIKYKSVSHNDFKHLFNSNLYEYIDNTMSVSPRNELESTLTKLFQERLKDSVLVDLGCGSPNSIFNAYIFSTAYDVRKYVGVEKYPHSEKESVIKEFTEDIPNYLKTNPGTEEHIVRLVNEYKHELPVFDYVNSDMLDFLRKRTALSNFMINGVDHIILNTENGKNDSNMNYFFELQKEIARLTPKGGLVFGRGSAFLSKLEEYGFENKSSLFGTTEVEQLWEKI